VGKAENLDKQTPADLQKIILSVVNNERVNALEKLSRDNTTEFTAFKKNAADIVKKLHKNPRVVLTTEEETILKTLRSLSAIKQFSRNSSVHDEMPEILSALTLVLGRDLTLKEFRKQSGVKKRSDPIEFDSQKKNIITSSMITEDASGTKYDIPVLENEAERFVNIINDAIKKQKNRSVTVDFKGKVSHPSLSLDKMTANILDALVKAGIIYSYESTKNEGKPNEYVIHV